MTGDLIPLFEGKEVRVLINTITGTGEPWFPLTDLAAAWGTDPAAPYHIVGRNPEVFHGFSRMSCDIDVTATSGKCVNEQGLYLLMGKISAGRLKNPEAKAAIIRFQRWVPELIRRYRKGEIVQREALEDLIQKHLKIADCMAQYAHVDRGIATSVALARVESETGADLSWVKGLIRKERQGSPGFLTPTQIGLELGGLSARNVNVMLRELGYQYFMQNHWNPTAIGSAYSENVPFTVPLRGGGLHSDYQLKWSPEIVRIIRDHLNGVRDARQALIASG